MSTISTGKKRKDYVIAYEYQMNGQTHQYRNRVKKNTFTQTLKTEQHVTLPANEKHPGVAFIKDIYLKFIWNMVYNKYRAFTRSEI